MRPSILNSIVTAILLLNSTGLTVLASEPQWIWGSESAHQKAADGECEFRRAFEVATKPVSVVIELVVDDQYTLRVNDRFIATSGDVSTARRIDVTSATQVGENVIYVRGRNSGGPAGFRARIQIEEAAGEKRTIVTDKTWQAKLQQAGTWDPSIRERTPWHQAYVLGPDGMAPWNGLVELSAEVEKVKSRAKSDGPFELYDGDRVAFLGNTFVERAQRYGFIECELTRRYPARNVSFRNLGWSGDTVFGEARARFGTVRDGFEHLETQINLVEPTLIFSAYGSNAAFAGERGLDSFVAGYERLLNVLEATGARVVLVSPMKHQNLGPPLPDHTRYNQVLAVYRDAIRQLAKSRRLGFLDLYDALDNADADMAALTDNGIHITGTGYRHAADVIADTLGITTDQPIVAFDAATLNTDVSGVTASPISNGDDAFSFQVTLDALPQPSVSMNDATVALILETRNLPDGNYEIRCDGELVAVSNAAKLADGVSIVRGPDVAQANLLRQTVHKKNELFFHRWRPQNETYLFLFRKHEQGNNAVEIPKFDPLVAEQESRIATLRVPKVHTYIIKRK